MYSGSAGGCPRTPIKVRRSPTNKQLSFERRVLVPSVRKLYESPRARSVPASIAALLLLGLGPAGCTDDDGGADGTTSGGTADGGPGGTDADGGTADGGTMDGGTTDGGEIEFEPANGGVRRLLSHEYVASVSMLLGPDAGAAADPPVDTPHEGWDAVGAGVLALDPVSIEQYEGSATAIADAVIANPATLANTVPCVTAGPFDASCFESVATDFGRLAFRRPLTDVEVTQLVDIANTGAVWEAGTGFESGLKYELMAILQAPSFLYASEVGEPDDASGYRRLTDLELATRMSLFLVGHAPNAALLDLAESGGLADAAAVRAQAEAMVASDEARVAVFSFFDELFRLRFLASTIKDPGMFPQFTPTLQEAMRQESLLLLHDVVWQNDGDYRDIFTANFTYLNDELATLYTGAPLGVGSNYMKVDWPAGQGRAGILSQGSFLAVHSHGDANSPSKRGKYVSQAVLCTPVPPPPPDVVAELPEPTPGQTLRDQLLAHKEDPACSSCHNAMDEFGFAYEYFDPIGAYRNLDNGLPISASGTLDGVGTWNDAAELGSVLKDDERLPLCVVNNLIRGELGHVETNGEEPEIMNLVESFGSGGYSLKGLMVDMVASPLFRYVDEPK